MENKGADAFYVDVHVEGFGRTDYLVDAGTDYMPIGEYTLAALNQVVFFNEASTAPDWPVHKSDSNQDWQVSKSIKR